MFLILESLKIKVSSFFVRFKNEEKQRTVLSIYLIAEAQDQFGCWLVVDLVALSNSLYN